MRKFAILSYVRKTVPTSFSQLYVVFGSGGQPSDKIYPAAYMLLPDKNSNTYKHAFQTLGNMTGAKPTSVSMDFEQSAISALKSVFPDVVIKGCAFHFKQSLRKNLGTKGCLKLYKQDENFQVGMQLGFCIDVCMFLPRIWFGLGGGCRRFFQSPHWLQLSKPQRVPVWSKRRYLTACFKDTSD